MAVTNQPLQAATDMTLEAIADFGGLVRQRAPFQLPPLSKGHHGDMEAARKAGLRGPVAYSLHYTGQVGEVLTRAYGARWTAGGRLALFFLKPVCAGDAIRITVGARPLDRPPPEPDQLEWLQVDVYNQLDELVASGCAGIVPA
ncbi:MAG: MaoC family dehydratase [Sphingomonas bacterium]